MDFEDSGPSNLQGDEPRKTPPIEREGAVPVDWTSTKVEPP